MEKKSNWSDLPKDLLESIGNCIDSPIDLLRFRSVCTSWRSSVSNQAHGHGASSALNLPSPIPPITHLKETTVCRLELFRLQPKGWLTKVKECRSNRVKLQLYHPLTDCPIFYHPIKPNLLDIRFVPICKSFGLVSPSGDAVYGVSKVVLYHGKKGTGISLLIVFDDGKLCYWREGDKNWTTLGDGIAQYDDLIEFNGQFYVVDRWGTVSWLDSSLNVIQYSPPLYGCGGKKHLVESRGELYIVDRYLDRERLNDQLNIDVFNLPERRRRYVRRRGPKAVDFRVYKLDEEWGKWVDVNSLYDQAFVLGTGCCFSISASEFAAAKGNCIYFIDDDTHVVRALSSDGFCVFRMEDRSIEKLLMAPNYCDVFWPPTHF